MKKLLLAGAAAFAMTSGVALAQTSYSQSTTTVQSTTPSPSDATYQSTKSTTVHRDGTETEKSQTYSSNYGGTTATSNFKKVNPDGSAVTTSHDEKTVTPLGDTTTKSTTTTTTTGR